MNIPNALSILRILLTPLFAALYLRGQTGAAVAVLLLCALTDVLDGYIARRFDMVTELGKALDPVADKLIQAAMMLCAAARTPPETSAALPKSVRNAAQPRPVRGSCPAQTTLPPLMSRCSRPPAWTAPSAARTLSVTRSAYCTRGRSGKHGSRSSSRPE